MRNTIHKQRVLFTFLDSKCFLLKKTLKIAKKKENNKEEKEDKIWNTKEEIIKVKFGKNLSKFGIILKKKKSKILEQKTKKRKCFGTQKIIHFPQDHA